MKYSKTNPIEKLHPGEPFFFIRAADIHSFPAILFYASQLEASGDESGANEVRGIAKAAKQWQAENFDKVKAPD